MHADSGFASNSIFTHLEGYNINYVIAGRMHQGIQSKISQLKTWTAIGYRIWISETEYKAAKWQQTRRVIVVRQTADIRPKATGKKLKLFDDNKFYHYYLYQIFYTN